MTCYNSTKLTAISKRGKIRLNLENLRMKVLRNRSGSSFEIRKRHKIKGCVLERKLRNINAYILW